mmetsp:Transcript_8069/g.16119  ORF Transcript_8069/g.16119 Transcript_8069/m.16119 type:complete len:214 (-) Transcript_8069:10-651(-)
MLVCLQHQARARRARWSGLRDQHTSDGFVEHLLQTLLGQGRAFQVAVCAQLGTELLTVHGRNWGQALLLQAADRLRVVTQIQLGTYQDEWDTWRVVLDLWVPLGLHVLKAGRADDRKADQKHISLRVRQRAQTIVIFLSGGIPKSQVDWLAVNHDIGRVVIEHGRDVLSWESIRRVRDQQARLTNSTITYNYTLNVLHCLVLSLRLVFDRLKK